MRGNPSAAQSNAEHCIDGWIEMYVSGRWTLGQFEAHLEAMLPVFTLEDWTPWSMRTDRRSTAKQPTRSWQSAMAAYATNYNGLISAATFHKGAA